MEKLGVPSYCLCIPCLVGMNLWHVSVTSSMIVIVVTSFLIIQKRKKYEGFLDLWIIV